MSTTTLFATSIVNGGEPKATLKPMGSRLLLVISSMSGSLEVKERQRRIQSIVDGLYLPEDQVEILDGADPASQIKQRREELFKQISSKVKQRRQTLFHLLQNGGGGGGYKKKKTKTKKKGDKGEEEASDDGPSSTPPQYPQLFLITPGGNETKYVGNAEEIFYLHATEKLARVIGLVSLQVETTIVNLTPAAAQQQATSKTTTWARRPSKVRRSLVVVSPAVQRRVSELVMTEYKGTERYENAAKRIQRVIRLWLLPVMKLKTKLQMIQDDTKRIVEKYKRNTQKTISNTKKRYDRDRLKVDKLLSDIQRQQKKYKLLKQDIRREEKIRDSCNNNTNPSDFNNNNNNKMQKKFEKYKREVEREKKHLISWDKDIENVRWENEKLLSCITNISELLAMRGVNWIELTKSPSPAAAAVPSNKEEKDDDDDKDKNQKLNNINDKKKMMNNNSGDTTTTTNSSTTTKQTKESTMDQQGKGHDEEEKAPLPPPAPPVSTVVVPIRRLEKSKSRLQIMMRQQTSRRRSSMTPGKNNNNTAVEKGKDDDGDGDGEEAPPMYFARLNSRAKLVLN